MLIAGSIEAQWVEKPKRQKAHTKKNEEIQQNLSNDDITGLTALSKVNFIGEKSI